MTHLIYLLDLIKWLFIQHYYLTLTRRIQKLTWRLLDLFKKITQFFPDLILDSFNLFTQLHILLDTRLAQLTYFTYYSTECSTYPTSNSISLKNIIIVTRLVQNIYLTFTQFILKIINTRLNLSSKLLILDSFNVLILLPTRLDTRLTHLIHFLLD